MDTMADTLPAADPRIGPLVNLTQGLINKYSELAGLYGQHISDESIRRELGGHVQDVLDEARQAYADVAAAMVP